MSIKLGHSESEQPGAWGCDAQAVGCMFVLCPPCMTLPAPALALLCSQCTRVHGRPAAVHGAAYPRRTCRRRTCVQLYDCYHPCIPCNSHPLRVIYVPPGVRAPGGGVCGQGSVRAGGAGAQPAAGTGLVYGGRCVQVRVWVRTPGRREPATAGCVCSGPTTHTRGHQLRTVRGARAPS